MRKLFGISFVVACLGVLSSHCSAAPVKTNPPYSNPWSKVTDPTTGSHGSIGFYSAGCLDGAQTLPENGPGFQVMRPSRNRYYGTTELMDFIENFTQKSVDDHVGVLLVGDLGQPRGGPMPYGHVSHQVGLDVDIWYLLYPDAQFRPLTPDERENLSSVSLVHIPDAMVYPDRWKPEHAKMLELAATMPEVDRIFVNAGIKRHLCDTIPAGERAWLHYLRPWFGHDDHFHVRLKCPKGAQYCKAQEPVADGDGCADMAWWFTPEARAQDEQVVSNTNTPNSMPTLPDLCAKILNDQAR